QRDRVVIARGKVGAKDRDGNLGSEIKILVDDAREVTHEQASGYQPSGKKVTPPKSTTKSTTKATIKSAAISPPPQKSTRVYIRLPKSDNHDLLLSLKRAIDEQQGDSEVVLVLGREDAKQIVRLPSRISSEDDSLKRLQSLVGDQNVVLQ